MSCPWAAKAASRGTLGGQPSMMTPGVERVVGQNPLDGRRRDRGDNAVTDHLPGQFGTLPLRQRPPDHIGAVARPCDDLQRPRRGKNRAAGPGVCCQSILRGPAPRNVGPTCGRAARVTLPGWPWPQRSLRRPTAPWHVLVWLALQVSSVSEATPSRGHTCGHPVQVGSLSGVPAYLPPVDVVQAS